MKEKMSIEEIRETIAIMLIMGRKKRDISQKQLSELSGVAEKTIYQLENFQGNPTLKTIDKLAKFFGCEPEDLLHKEKRK